MCGLVGVVGQIFPKHEAAFFNLLKLDTLRGHHSTGVYGIDRNDGGQLFKSVGTPWDLDNKVKVAFSIKIPTLYIGHNRYATKGKVNEANAHPFDLGSVVGAHNGTIKNQYVLDDNKDYETDSENIFHSIAKIGSENTIKKLNGAFALVWFNKEDNTLNFCRNKERPLFYAYTKDKKAMFWASEKWMIEVALNRVGLDYLDIMTFEVGKLYTTKVPQKALSSDEDMDIMVCRKVDFYEPPVHVHYAHKQTTYYKNSESKVSKLTKFLGKLVNFSVVGPVEGKNQNFIRAYLDNIPDVIEVRVFLSSKENLYDKLFDENLSWEGQVKKVSQQGGATYLVLDNRTIKTIVSPTEKVTKIDDRILCKSQKNLSHSKPKQEWLDVTSAGCTNCGEIPNMGDSGSLVWMNRQDFFCSSCMSLREVQEFISAF